MIGNDVIDLKLARKQSNWKRRGFLQKLFSKAEQNTILTSENPEFWVWQIWSRKEAVYKIINRASGIREFIPLKIECFSEELNSDFAMYQRLKFYTKTESCSDYIHSIAVAKFSDFENVILLKDRSSIVKSRAIPFCRFTNNPVSISHHGNYQRIIQLTTNQVLA